MNQNFIEYFTFQNDRLDLIAFKAYGNQFDWGPIICANPSLPIQDFYSAGIRILIPIQSDPETSPTITNQLPPWKK